MLLSFFSSNYYFLSSFSSANTCDMSTAIVAFSEDRKCPFYIFSGIYASEFFTLLMLEESFFLNHLIMLVFREFVTPSCGNRMK